MIAESWLAAIFSNNCITTAVTKNSLLRVMTLGSGVACFVRVEWFPAI